MNAVTVIRRVVCCVSLLAWCLEPGVLLAQPPDNLHAETSSYIGYDGSVVGAPVTADSFRSSIGAGWYQVTDSVSIQAGPFGPSFPHPGEDGFTDAYETFSTTLFSWYSLTELPGSTYFPKIFSGADGGTNVWQTTTPVQASPGVVSIQNIAFPNYDLPFGSPPYPPIFGPITYFNALAWSATGLMGGARTAPINSGSLTSTLTLDEGSEVRLESAVRPDGNRFRYEYTLENLTDEILTIAWDSAGLTRTLAPFETLIETVLSDYSAMESQGYAHVLGATPVADMVSMALVPTAPEPGTIALLVLGAVGVLRRSVRR